MKSSFLFCCYTVVLLLILMSFPNRAAATEFEEFAKLIASDGAEDELFGNSVSVSGDVALLGARWDDDQGFESGSGYVF